MPKSVMQDLRAYLESFYDPPERVFMYTSQKILTARLAKYAALAGVHKIRLHDLRHSHASFLIHKGVPITAISQRLGHKSPKITLDVYSHVYSASDGEIAKILETI
jgi:integrase